MAVATAELPQLILYEFLSRGSHIPHYRRLRHLLREQTRRVDAFGFLPLVHLWHPPQSEKTAVQPIGGRQRYVEISSMSVAARIARLRERPHGDIGGPATI